MYNEKDLRAKLSTLMAEAKGKREEFVNELDNVSDPAYRLTLQDSVVFYNGEMNGIRKVVEYINTPPAEPLVIVGNDIIRKNRKPVPMAKRRKV